MALISNPDGQVSQTKTMALIGGIGGMAMAIVGGVLLAMANPAGAGLVATGIGLITSTGLIRQLSNSNRAKYEEAAAINRVTEPANVVTVDPAIVPGCKENEGI